MKRATKKQIAALLAKMKKAGAVNNWSCYTEKNGNGDYGKNETYSHADKPIFMLSISYNPPKTTGYIA